MNEPMIIIAFLLGIGCGWIYCDYKHSIKKNFFVVNENHRQKAEAIKSVNQALDFWCEIDIDYVIPYAIQMKQEGKMDSLNKIMRHFEDRQLYERCKLLKTVINP